MALSDRLNSWQEIAAYLHRDIDTVRRWEKTLGLPVQRPAGVSGAVHARRVDVDAWRAVHADRLEAVVPARSGAGWSRLLFVVLLIAAAGGLFAWYAHVPAAPRAPAMEYFTESASNRPVTGAAISPDGQRLAYADEGGVIYLLTLSSRATERLTLPAGLAVQRIAWLGERALVVSGVHSIWRISTAGEAAHRIVEGGQDAVPSPDGRRIAYADGESDIWIAEADGRSAPRRLAKAQAGEVLRALFWSSDGRRVACGRRQRRSGNSQGGSSYESLDAVTGAITARTFDLRMDSAFGLADGRILYSADRADAGLWEVRSDPQTGALQGVPVRIVESGSETGISASRDGRRIAGVAQSPSWSDVLIASIEQPGPRLGSLRKLTQDRGGRFPQAWLPDSSAIVFESTRGASQDIFRQRLDGGAAEAIVASPAMEYLPQLAPDGRWLLYTSRARPAFPPTLWRVPVAGGTATEVPIGGPLDEFRCPAGSGRRCVLRVTEKGQYIFFELDPIRAKGREFARTAWTAGVLGDWAVSPDGGEVAIPIHNPGAAKLRLVSLRGGREREVALPGMSKLKGLHYAADGRGWFVASERGGNGTHHDYVSREGRVQPLMDVEGTSWMVPSPDGRLVAIVDYARSRRAWVFERR